MKLRLFGVFVAALTIFSISAYARSANKCGHSHFDVRLIDQSYEDLDKNKSLEEQAGVVNVVLGNSFSIDLKKGVVKIEATQFEKIVRGGTYGSQIEIEPQEVSLPLNCCYNTVFVYEYTPDKEKYKTVYGRPDRNSKDSNPWVVVVPRTKIK